MTSTEFEMLNVKVPKSQLRMRVSWVKERNMPAARFDCAQYKIFCIRQYWGARTKESAHRNRHTCRSEMRNFLDFDSLDQSLLHSTVPNPKPRLRQPL
jgi:hypothetical protein